MQLQSNTSARSRLKQPTSVTFLAAGRVARSCVECGAVVGKHAGYGLCAKHYKAKQRAEGKTQPYNQTYLKAWIRSATGRYSALRRAAKVKNLGFDITPEQHLELLTQPCVYCRGQLCDTGHGLDRKDSAQGYTINNIVPCCVVCNRIKNEYLTYAEMIVAMQAVMMLRGSFEEKLGNGG